MKRAASLFLLLAVALGIVAIYGHAHPDRCHVVPEQMQLVPRDKPLMTEQERAWAQESGIGAYTWEGVTVIDEGLPESYWQPQQNE